jgi:hypothetical protein
MVIVGDGMVRASECNVIPPSLPLLRRRAVPMIRRTFLEILAHGKLDEKTGDLVMFVRHLFRIALSPASAPASFSLSSRCSALVFHGACVCMWCA